ncbi:MAG: M28 family peptidase [Bacteroidetes bacterium]|nr:M28 family peptidase [Bacteroidota bacterium]
MVRSAGRGSFSCEFEFDYLMCNRTRHSQLLSIIPGHGPLRKELVILEAHLDSRCESLCDTICLAEGADDNGSGSALLMEISRNLCLFSLSRTIVILWVTGEEQGLGGSRSFATFCKQNAIPIKAVFNNDIVGGIECGKTSSLQAVQDHINMIVRDCDYFLQCNQQHVKKSCST